MISISSPLIHRELLTAESFVSGPQPPVRRIFDLQQKVLNRFCGSVLCKNNLDFLIVERSIRREPINDQPIKP
jgi:hypothetical protein